MKRRAIFLIVFPLLLLLSQQALAGSGCPSRYDLKQLGALPDSDGDYRCDLLVAFTINTGAGPTEVEIYGKEGRTNPERIVQAMHDSGEALSRFPGYGSVPVKIYLSNRPLAYDFDGDKYDQGRTNLSSELTEGDRPSCIIAMFRTSIGPEFPPVLAHEFFHCVEFSAFDNKMYSPGSAWWSESAAEWFADLVYPGTGFSDGFVEDFDAKSPTTSLVDMKYENVVFLWWLEQKYGAQKVFDLMAAMPDDYDSTSGDGAQADALAAFLPEGDFLEFAEDYLDQTLLQTGGRAVASSPDPGTVYEIVGDSALTLDAPRFVVFRATLAFGCGNWKMIPTLRAGLYGVAKNNNGMWETLAADLAPDREGTFEYRLAGIGSGADGFALDLRTGRDRAFYESGPAACLVGDWSLVAGGLGKIQGDLINGMDAAANAEIPDLQAHLVLKADGTFTLGPATRGHMESTTSSGTSATDFVLRFTRSGTWAVRHGHLERCYDTTGPGEVAFTTRHADGSRSSGRGDMLPRGLPEFIETKRYSCEGNRLEIEYMRILFKKINLEYEK